MVMPHQKYVSEMAMGLNLGPDKNIFPRKISFNVYLHYCLAAEFVFVI